MRRMNGIQIRAALFEAGRAKAPASAGMPRRAIVRRCRRSSGAAVPRFRAVWLLALAAILGAVSARLAGQQRQSMQRGAPPMSAASIRYGTPNNPRIQTRALPSESLLSRQKRGALPSEIRDGLMRGGRGYGVGNTASLSSAASIRYGGRRGSQPRASARPSVRYSDRSVAMAPTGRPGAHVSAGGFGGAGGYGSTLGYGAAGRNLAVGPSAGGRATHGRGTVRYGSARGRSRR